MLETLSILVNLISIVLMLAAMRSRSHWKHEAEMWETSRDQQRNAADRLQTNLRLACHERDVLAAQLGPLRERLAHAEEALAVIRRAIDEPPP